MTGSWLAAIAGRLLHDDIQALFVSPAIADLQYERATAPWWQQARAYVAVCRAMAGAIRFQATSGVQTLLADDARLLALQSDVQLIAGLLLLQLTYYAGLLGLIVALIQ